MNGLVSVLVAIYNVEKYLRECLDSILNQTYTNLEIICVDDSSTDSSYLILEEYAKKDDRVQIHRIEHSGLPSVRNKGLDCATGQYIFFVDGDDLLNKNCVEYLLRAFDHGAKLTLSGYKSFADGSEVPDINTTPEYVETKITRAYKESICRYTVWSKIYRVEDVVRFWGKNENFQDGFFDIEILNKVYDSVYKVENELYYYRMRGGSESRRSYDWRLKNTIDDIVTILKSGVNNIFLGHYGLKLAFRARWITMLRNDRSGFKYLDKQVRFLWNKIKKSDIITSKDKLACFLCTYFPTFYSYGRLVVDSTLRSKIAGWKNGEKWLELNGKE